VSTPKKTAPKPSVEAALRKKLTEYAETLDDQNRITEEQAERLREMSARNTHLECRVTSFIDTMAAIRKTCVAGGVADAESMVTQSAVERLAARVADVQRTRNALSQSISHRRTMQDVLESCGYTVEYRKNGSELSITRRASAAQKAVAEPLTCFDGAVVPVLLLGSFTVGWLIVQGITALCKWLA
jgi:predicted RNase H-like nuclease (RuvC/YqgF family)